MWEALLERGVSGAPQLIEWLAIGVGLAIATFMGRVNMLKGKQVAKGQDYQIAGAVIDKDAAATIVAALRANTRAVEKNTEAAENTGEEIVRAAEEIRVLTRELIRTQQK